MCVCLNKEKSTKKYLHNNQIIQNPYAPELVLDLVSIMSGRGNTTMLRGIIEEVQSNMCVCLDKEDNENLFAQQSNNAKSMCTRVGRRSG